MSEISEAVAEAMKAVREAEAEERQAEEKAEEARKAMKEELKNDILPEIGDVVAKALAEHDKKETWKEVKGEVANPKKAQLGSGGAPEEGPMDEFNYWMRTGDQGATRGLTEDMEGDLGLANEDMTRKAFAEGSGSGSYAVPSGHVERIFAARDVVSFPRQMGVRVIQTDVPSLVLPAESSTTILFDRIAEAGSYAASDPTIAQNSVTVHKWARLRKISEELLEDRNSNIEQWFNDVVGREMGLTEAYYVANGSGTNQHEGIFEGGDTDALTFNTDGGGDSDGNLVADAAHHLLFTLAGGYRTDAAWLASDATLRSFLTLRHTSANPNWAFQGADMMSWRPDGTPMLLGKPFYTQADIPALATGVCGIMVGSPAYYALVERRGLSVSRNPFLYQASGQVGFFYSFRQTGKVLNALAWVGGVGA